MIECKSGKVSIGVEDNELEKVISYVPEEILLAMMKMPVEQSGEAIRKTIASADLFVILLGLLDVFGKDDCIDMVTKSVAYLLSEVRAREGK